MVDDENQLLISITDIIAALKRGRFLILAAALLGMVLFGWFCLTRYTFSFEAEGSMKTKQKEMSGLGSKILNLSDTPEGGYISDDDPKNFLNSHPVAETVAKEQHLQGFIFENKTAVKTSSLYQGLLAFKAQCHFGARAPKTAFGQVEACPEESDTPFSREPCSLVFKELIYPLHAPTQLSLRCIDENRFIVNETKEGKFGRPFTQDGYTFTLKGDGSPLSGRQFQIHFSPLKQAATLLSNAISIKSHPTNNQLLKVTCNHPSPHMATKLLNGFMDGYTRYVRKEGLEKINHQLNYLSEREQAITVKLRNLTKAQANFAAEELDKGSFSLLGDPKSAASLYQNACNQYSTLSMDVQSLHESIFGCYRPIEEVMIAIDDMAKEEPTLLEGINSSTRQAYQGILAGMNQQLEGFALKFQNYDNLLELLDRDDFELVALSGPAAALLSDGEVARLSRYIAGPNHTAKERAFATEQIREEKDLIRKRVSQLRAMEKEEIASIGQRMLEVQKGLAVAIVRELKIIEKDIAHHLIRCGEHVDQALFEHNAFLNKDVLSKFQGELLNMAEAKNLAFNLEAIENKPFEWASAPFLPVTPALRKFGVVGALIGATIVIAFLILREIFRGPLATAINLRSLGRRVVNSETAFIESNHKGMVCSVLGKEPALHLTLAKKLALSERKVLIFHLYGEKRLNMEKPSIQKRKSHDELELGEVQDRAILQGATFIKLVDSLKQKYDAVIFVGKTEFGQILAPRCDKMFYAVTTERIKEIVTPPLKTFYYQEEKVTVKKRSLKEAITDWQLSIPSSVSSSSAMTSSS
ncbi:MAG: hypothetical protein S4CHLAM81_14610 [Chlamydiales bacterium]|nr:hypothetical protein [Chlamydiales bacterium]MCH9703779.1 hypothetical protein [Chlamydiota bacterium]